MRNRFFGWALSALLCLGSTNTSLACAFHGYTPNPTLVDVLLATEDIALLRLDPTNSNRYKLLEILSGAEVSEFPIPVTASIRKLLTERPSASLLVARDGAYGPWMALTILDPGFEKIVKKVVERQSELLIGGDDARVALFAKLLNSPNLAVNALALQELDRAPYSALRAARLPKLQNLKRELETGDEAFMPIRVLLAGLSRDQSLSSFLSEELDMAIEGNIPYMGAYATALIELNGKAAVRDILDRYLAPRALPLETRTKLLEALSVQHKAAPRATRREIAKGVAELLRTSPDLKEPAARFFGFLR